MNEEEAKRQIDRVQLFKVMSMELLYNQDFEKNLSETTSLDLLNFISGHKKRLAKNLAPSDLYAIKDILTNSVALYNDTLKQSLENL